MFSGASDQLLYAALETMIKAEARHLVTVAGRSSVADHHRYWGATGFSRLNRNWRTLLVKMKSPWKLQNTCSEILQEYGDIADVMEVSA
jgi:hypothetical protein